MFSFFLFSSFFIATVCLAALYQTYTFLHLPFSSFSWYGSFAFFATLCSYNFHWWLTPIHQMEAERSIWSKKHRWLHLWLSITGIVIAYISCIKASEHWLQLFPALLLTFLYTAPKIERWPFILLRKMAVGKTIYLATVWTYVTAVLPVLLTKQQLNLQVIIFIAGKFFFLLALCMLFDWRDQLQDKQQAIRSLATLLSAQQLRFYLRLSLYVSLFFSLMAPSVGEACINSLPVLTTLILVPFAWKSSSDYLYYGLLDGLMGVSGLLYFCQKML